MANLETQKLDSIISSRRAMLAVGGAALAGLALSSKASAQAAAAIGDTDILNFALNLEYLEAQFYCLAVNGVTIDQGPQAIPLAPNASTLGPAGTVTTKTPFAAVPFTDAAIAAYAKETATEEGNHVLFLQSALSTKAVSMPDINLVDSFNALAGVAKLPIATFDPFGSNAGGAISADASFLLGAYIFEDTGVSAYHGAAPLIADKVNYLPPAIGIHAVEAYHAGLVRTSINRLDAGTGSLNPVTVLISAARTMLGTTTDSTGAASSSFDTGIANVTVMLNGTTALPATTIVDADNSSTGLSIAQGRSTTAILQIVTGMTTAPAAGAKYKGVFFPSGLNGLIGTVPAAPATATKR